MCVTQQDQIISQQNTSYKQPLSMLEPRNWQGGKMPRIYVAHPYGRRIALEPSELEANAQKAVMIGRQLMMKGWNPMIPNLYHYVHKGWVKSPDEVRWFHMVSEWIQFCDAFFYGGQSDGCDREWAIAQSYGLTIYENIEDVPDA